MAREQLTLETVARLDGGRIAQAWQQALDRLQADCVDRPGLKDPRKVTLTAVVVPQKDEESRRLESCAVQFEVAESVPKKKSKVYDAGVARDRLVVNDLSPEDAGQMTLDDARPRAAEVGSAG